MSGLKSKLPEWAQWPSGQDFTEASNWRIGVGIALVGFALYFYSVGMNAHLGTWAFWYGFGDFLKFSAVSLLLFYLFYVYGYSRGRKGFPAPALLASKIETAPAQAGGDNDSMDFSTAN